MATPKTRQRLHGRGARRDEGAGQELKAEASKADAEAAVLAEDRRDAGAGPPLADGSTPSSRPPRRTSRRKTWYGMPAYAKDGKIVCFFKSADKFKTRYATFGFKDEANLDDGQCGRRLRADRADAAVETKIRALVKKAARPLS